MCHPISVCVLIVALSSWIGVSAVSAANSADRTCDRHLRHVKRYLSADDFQEIRTACVARSAEQKDSSVRKVVGQCMREGREPSPLTQCLQSAFADDDAFASASSSKERKRAEKRAQRKAEIEAERMERRRAEREIVRQRNAQQAERARRYTTAQQRAIEAEPTSSSAGAVSTAAMAESTSSPSPSTPVKAMSFQEMARRFVPASSNNPKPDLPDAKGLLGELLTGSTIGELAVRGVYPGLKYAEAEAVLRERWSYGG